MKPNLQLIEPLEARVAPAILVNGPNLLGGKGNPTTGETSTGANTLTLIKVISGQALVFYKDGEITGVSVGKHTQLDITGDIHGDIITNLLPSGRLTDSDNDPSNGEDGGILLPIGIKGITTGPLDTQKGGIGRIIAGGQVNNVSITGQISGIYAGDGIFRDGEQFQVNTGDVNPNLLNPSPTTVAGDYTYTVSHALSSANAKAGIKNITVATASQLEIFAGNGAASDQSTGLAGGSITNVTITATKAGQGTAPALFLHAGDGGSGVDKGGAGGSINSFKDQGSSAYVRLQTGDGGSSESGNGGEGGSLTGSTIVTSSPRYDIFMGNGGNGQHGGPGGNLSALTFTNNVTGGKSLIATDDFNADGYADVVLLNTLTGQATVSLGTAPSGNPLHANFQIVLQNVTQSDGTATQTPFLPSEGADPTSLVVGDFNGDSRPDFAVSYASTNSVGIFTNQGGGHFAASQLSLAVSPTRIVTGDFSNTGHTDLAIVSAADLLTQNGQSSQVFIAHNDGTGHFNVGTTAVATIAGTATDAAASVAYSATDLGTVLGANLYVGLDTGAVQPILFRGGIATTGTQIPAFAGTNAPPVDNLDAVGSVSGSTQILVFSHDINAVAIANGSTSLKSQAEALVYTVSGTGQLSSPIAFDPGDSVVRVRFVQNSPYIGVEAPDSFSLYAFTASATAPATYSSQYSLGSDAQLSDFDVANLNGTYQIAASGAASNTFSFSTGQPSATVGFQPFSTAHVPFEPRLISLASGNGGDGDGNGGGNGGAIKGVSFTQTLGAGVIEAGGSYGVTLTSGHGGSSNGAGGGKGGVIEKSTLSLNPSYITNTDNPATDIYTDDTTTAAFNAGAGGQGLTGGQGGSIRKVSSSSVFSQTVNNSPVLGAVAVRMLAGDGGVGLDGAGGNGGGVKLAGQAALNGVTFVDPNSLSGAEPGLIVQAGDGGDGVTAGGKGGTLTNVGTQNVLINGMVLNRNQLASAQLVSGSGGAASDGDGGAAGDIRGANVVVQESNVPIFSDSKPTQSAYVKDGSVSFLAGAGGVSASARGGAGGNILSSTIGSTSGDHVINRYGSLVEAGAGGAGGAGGGAGGSVGKLSLNSPVASDLYAAVIAAGSGGNATDGGIGGAGGSISSVKQSKDVNSAINVIQAGNGGQGAGDIGGTGGSVSDVSTVGFIGLPSAGGAFYTIPTNNPSIAPLFAYSQIPQGIFAGQGGDGAANGSVLNVVARQIAAIGASIQANGTFATASSVSNVSADLIGYGSNPPVNSPSAAVPTSGFILAETVSGISTVDNDRTKNFTYHS